MAQVSIVFGKQTGIDNTVWTNGDVLHPLYWYAYEQAIQFMCHSHTVLGIESGQSLTVVIGLGYNESKQPTARVDAYPCDERDRPMEPAVETKEECQKLLQRVIDKTLLR